MLTERRSGILLHPTSLPGPQPVGSLGKEAYRFIDQLVDAKQSIWQILPLGPAGYGDCPYSCYSAFAGSPLLIDLELLVESGELERADIPPAQPSTDQVDFFLAKERLTPCLTKACQNFKQTQEARQDAYKDFCNQQAFWLDGYSLFQALREQHEDSPWNRWPEEFRHFDAITETQRQQLSDAIEKQKLIQFFFFDQWLRLKQYANDRGVQILGDLPIFVAEDSADVWTNQALFHLDQSGNPTLVAGVPPDYFSATGQRWGNPLYRWDRMAEDDFSWWQARFDWNFQLFDMVRVDHFRGFSGCWAIPVDHPTAEHGEWIEVPGRQLFEQLLNGKEQLPLIAEDLGIITPDVTALRDHFNLPGMKILQFAFDSGADNPYLPHNLTPNSVVYTGTHDNNTSLGWWRSLDGLMKQKVKDYLRQPCRQMPWPLIETAFSSVSLLAVCPMQDALGLASNGRMNTPGTANGNWGWRMKKGSFNEEVRDKIKNLSHLYGRNLCITTEM